MIEDLSSMGSLTSENFQGIIGKGDLVVNRMRTAVDQILQELASGIRGCLKLVSGGRQIFIRATDGKETIADASDVFKEISRDYNDLGLNRRSASTRKQKVEVYQLVEDANFMRIFTSLGRNLDSLCLTQAQIKAFCQDHYNELENGTAKMPNLFLFKAGQDFYVAWIYRSSHGEDRPKAPFVYRLEDREEIIHGSSNNVLVILPEL